MESFEDLGIGPALSEALLSEGIEVPTELQRHAIPVLRRGNPAVLQAGPGSGAVLAYGLALLDRIDPDAGVPGALVLAPTRESAGEIASSIGRVALASGHRCAALGGSWALPERADILCSTPSDLHEAIRAAEVKLEGVETLVLHAASVLLEDEGVASVLGVLELLPSERQVVAVADPVTERVREFVEEHVRRAVFLPPDAAGRTSREAPVERGEVGVAATRPRHEDETIVAVVAGELSGDAHHVLLYARSADRAADLGDLLSLHGYPSSSPGNPDAPVWLGLDPLEARGRMQEAGIDRELVVPVSADVPSDADTFDRRHGGGGPAGTIAAAPRELPHLRRVAREAGYRLREVRPSSGTRDDVGSFRDEVVGALEREDLAAYATLLEPLFERWTATEVAAALAALLRARGEVPPKLEAPRDTAVAPARGRPPAWARLFLSVGSRDGIGPGDLLGAITGEAGVKGGQVGRIDIKDTFSRVEVEDAEAARVIQALNGISIRGRSVRADFDRGERRDAGGPGPGGSGGRAPGGRGRGGSRGGGKSGGPRRDRE